MKTHFCFISFAVIGAAFFCGCDNDHQRATDGRSDSTEVHLFEKGKGLRLPDEMQRSLGVETVEVAEKRIEHRVERPAHVYRAAGDSLPAAALVWLGESDAAQVNVGQWVSLKLSNGEAFTGTIARLEQRLTNLLGQSEAVIEFSDSQRRVTVGSLLTATFVSTNINAVTAVPASAVVRGVESTFVYTVSGSHYVRTPVTLGAESAGWVEITDGLYTGDVVVARAVDALWTIELCALKGGTPCCPVGRKPDRHDD